MSTFGAYARNILCRQSYDADEKTNSVIRPKIYVDYEKHMTTLHRVSEPCPRSCRKDVCRNCHCASHPETYDFLKEQDK